MRYLVFISLLLTAPSWAESRRIEVYPLSQHYWDIEDGDTLVEIVDRLMPANHYLQEKLMLEIISLNPAAFPDGSPDRMLANRRLWLPNAAIQPAYEPDSSEYTVESYQWGSIRKNRGERQGAGDRIPR